MTPDDIGTLAFLAVAAVLFVWGVRLAYLVERDRMDRDIDRALEEPRDDRQVATRLDGGWLS